MKGKFKGEMVLCEVYDDSFDCNDGGRIAGVVTTDWYRVKTVL